MVVDNREPREWLLLDHYVYGKAKLPRDAWVSARNDPAARVYVEAAIRQHDYIRDVRERWKALATDLGEMRVLSTLAARLHTLDARALNALARGETRLTEVHRVDIEQALADPIQPEQQFGS